MTLDVTEVQRLKSTLGVLHRVEVHVSITQSSSSHTVSAHSDARNRPDCVEDLVQHILADFGTQIPDVERGELSGRGIVSLGGGIGCRSNLSSRFLVFLVF